MAAVEGGGGGAASGAGAGGGGGGRGAQMRCVVDSSHMRGIDAPAPPGPAKREPLGSANGRCAPPVLYRVLLFCFLS